MPSPSQKTLKTFFSSFTTSSSNLTTSNTTLFYDEHVITFTSNDGEIFNLKFKNEISNIYPILNGIIIQLVQSSNRISFFYQNHLPSSISYRNFILTSSPLSAIAPLSLPNDSNFSIIRTSKKFPFLLSTSPSQSSLSLLLMLSRRSLELKDFEDNIKKMLDSTFEPFNLSNDPLAKFPVECSFNLLKVCEFKEVNCKESLKTKIYTCYSEKNAIFIAALQRGDLYVFCVRFCEEFEYNNSNNNNNNSYIEKDVTCFKNVVCFNVGDSFISEKYELSYDVKGNEAKKESKVMSEFFKMNSLKGISKYKTLCFLTKDGNFIFLECGYMIFSYKFNEIEYNVLDFKIRNKREFYFYLNNNNDIAQINKTFELNDKNAILLLKFFYIEIGTKEIYYLLLNCLYEHISKTKNKNARRINHFSYLCFIIWNIIIHSVGKYTHFPNDQLTQTEQREYLSDIDYMEYNPTLIHNKITMYINKEKPTIIKSLLDFMKEMVDNIKISNNYSHHYTISICIDFILNILSFLNDYSISFHYLQSLMVNYQLSFSKHFPLSINHCISYSPMHITSKFKFNHLTHIKRVLNFLTHSANDNNVNVNTSMSISDAFNGYSLFSRSEKSELKDFVCENFITALLKANYTLNHIKKFHWRISLNVLKGISLAKNNPYRYLTNSYDYDTNMKILSLINRIDLARNLSENVHRETMENLTSMLYKNEVSDYNSEYYLTKIKFANDTRIIEANRILSPTRILKLNSSQLSSIIDLNQLEIEKFLLVSKSLIRQYTSCVGNGALNLSTIKTFPKEILNIKPLNTQCFLTADESTYNLDSNSEKIKDKDFSQWAEFHNGVAQSLKLSTDKFNNKSYIRNWILFNKPSSPSYEHGGFLFGLGLLKQLDSLYATDVYQYMKSAHDGVTIGILLGRSASKISSMEETLSRTLCLHISFLIPSTLEINIPMNVQCSAVIGLGMIYMNSGNRLMIEMLLNQIGKISNNSDKSVDMKHLDSYNLCLGFAIGLINLGLGKANANYDLNYEEKLLMLINGTSTDECSSPREILNGMLNVGKIQNATDGNNNSQINVNQTAPSAYACLALSYLQSKNAKIASLIKIPDNLYKLDTFRPLHLYLAILTRNLIMWDEVIKPSNDWVYSNIPSFIRFLYENPLSVISEDVSMSYKVNLIEFSLITTSYFFSLCAGIMSLAFKYCGTNNKTVNKIVLDVIQTKLLKLKVVTDIIIKDNTKYNDINKCAINKTSLDECLCICSFAAAIIMAGSGDLETFKTLRILRKKVDSVDYKNFLPGYTQSIDHAIGILFLGSGGLTFKPYKNSIAFLFISTFPIFAKTLNDNEKYLQPLRHLYVLACENKIFETRDIKTNMIIHTQLKIEYLNGTVKDVITPCNLEEVDYIKKIYMKKCEGYYDMEIDREDIEGRYLSSNNSMEAKVAFIKRKSIFNKDVELSVRVADSISTVLNAVRKVKEWRDESEKSKVNEDIFILSDVIIEQIANAYKKMNDRNKNFSLTYMKASLVFLVYYVNSDNIEALYIINDYLNMLYIEISKGEWVMFEVIAFFYFIASEREKEAEGDEEDFGFIFALCLKEIKGYIQRKMVEKYKDALKGLYIKIQSGKMDEVVDWNLIQFAQLNGVKINELIQVMSFICDRCKYNQFASSDDILSQMIIRTKDNKEINAIVNENNYDFICYIINIIKE